MARRRRVAVIGGGIIGVSSALRVVETLPDLEVTLIAEKLSPYTTGDGSAGFWSPYLLGEVPPHVIRFWCGETFDFLRDIYKTPEASECGVGLLSGFRLYQKPQGKPSYFDIYLEHRNMNPKELALFPSRYRYGTFLTTFYTECNKFIPFLMKQFQDKGGRVIQKKLDSITQLSGVYDAVINCPGVEAAKFVPDPSVSPIRGQVMRVRAPWIKHAVIGDDDYYILPNSEEVICGGTHQVGNWSTEVDSEDTKCIWEGCTELVPSLKKAEILREWVGLRPGRPEPRLERETLFTEYGPLEVVHNYGHGGSGVTLFWGCAIHAVNLLREALESIRKNSRL